MPPGFQEETLFGEVEFEQAGILVDGLHHAVFMMIEAMHGNFLRNSFHLPVLIFDPHRRGIAPSIFPSQAPYRYQHRQDRASSANADLGRTFDSKSHEDAV